MSKYKDFESLMTYEINSSSKERIMNAAIYTIATVGYVQSTTKRIAELADVSEALIFKYYGSKQKLLGAVSMEIMQHRLPKIYSYKLDELFQEETDFTIEVFLEVLKEKFTYISENSGYFKIIYLELGYNSDETIGELQRIINRSFLQIGNYVVRLQKMHILRSDLPPQTIYRSFAGMFSFLLMDKKMMNKALKIEQEIEWMLTMFMEGAGEDV